MKRVYLASTAMLALALSGAPAFGEGAVVLPPWAMNVAGEKLTAVDGSTVILHPQDDGLAIEHIMASGAAQTTAFTYVSEKLGTVADSADASHIVGFFRVGDSTIETQFADGHTEKLAANGDGLSLTTRGSAASCMAWYPAGHVFGVAERRAAVAAYAASLGLEKPAKGKVVPVATTCAIAPVRPARTASIAAPSAPGLLAPLAAVAVRVSDVHSVPEAIPLATASTTLLPAAPIPAQLGAPKPQLAAVTASPASTKAEMAAGHGASDCLNVESDGQSLGFHNRCLFSVSFAYCVQDRDDSRTPCDLETRSGAVAAHGFLALLADTNIRAEDAEHNFHWVGCSGGAAEVTAYLDHAEPATGRCVLTKPAQTLTNNAPQSADGANHENHA